MQEVTGKRMRKLLVFLLLCLFLVLLIFLEVVAENKKNILFNKENAKRKRCIKTKKKFNLLGSTFSVSWQQLLQAVTVRDARL